ncbi:J domain-containing protein [Natrinema versiforme]|uniref:Heat shock protein DnaJ domain protein n=1 Tax=Natrinema versiforme JCM 10478 TaxID=1227496 RepID=L9Y8P1_9EURY|nr:J domain-containing protein [Natrinema versiforme]ELY69293.1 heat shock protein DnaJ domain protein [Natrinema versiforme JCM 10478]
MGETYYDVLKVDPTATRDEIEAAYRERVLETHPDHSDDPDAAEQFQRVTTAKSVLTDGTERARYDRLGHESYVGLAHGGEAQDSDDSNRENATAARSDSESRHTTTGRTSTGGKTTTNGTSTASTTNAGSSGSNSGSSDTGDRRTNATARGPSEWAEWVRTNAGSMRTESDGTDRTACHHARQRSERRRQRAKQRAAGDWPFDSDGPSASSATTDTPPGETEDTQENTAPEYSVHDWNGEVDLEWEGPAIDRTTAMSVGAVALLYPLFVAASLTPLFSLSINAIIAACTLALIGYLLTMPRIAAAAFGGWSVLFPVGMLWSTAIDPLSLFGLFALGFAWIPFGYAIALWWILRP